jgi:hypothetical protein
MLPKELLLSWKFCRSFEDMCKGSHEPKDTIDDVISVICFPSTKKNVICFIDFVNNGKDLTDGEWKFRTHLKRLQSSLLKEKKFRGKYKVNFFSCTGLFLA